MQRKTDGIDSRERCRNRLAYLLELLKEHRRMPHGTRGTGIPSLDQELSEISRREYNEPFPRRRPKPVS